MPTWSSSLLASNEASLPRQLGPYRVARRLGEGGMGVVFEAVDEGGERVAVKTLQALDPQALHGFKQEFRTVASLNHPNVVRLYELQQADGVWFFSMELISGTDLIDHLRPSDGSSADRIELIREAMRQLSAGVHALHAANLLHLDLKPANVLVDRKGRVVLLDFGLVRPAGRAVGGLDTNGGTPRYMAPEQLQGRQASAASDWYAVGLMLYEALTGDTPFGDAPWNVLVRPKGAPPLRPSERAAGIPADLDDLCADLLSADPSARPEGAEVLARLGANGVRVAPPPVADSVAFVGRGAQRAALWSAFRAVEAGSSVMVHVTGPSGVGKTALIGQFLREVATSEKAAVITGRCLEWESLPYKGFDPAIDELCRQLMSMSPQRRDEILVPGVENAAQLFPVLGTCLPDRPPSVVPGDSPQHQRMRAHQALKTLLVELGRDRPLVIFLDDVQWGDSDGARLATALLTPPDPPRLLFIVASRREQAEQSSFLQELSEARRADGVVFSERTLALEPLGIEEACELAAALLRPGTPQEQARSLAMEAGGQPFLLEALARLAAVDGDVVLPAPKVEDVLAARLAPLSLEARAVLEVVAVAGVLPAQEVALDIVGAGRDRYRIISELRGAALVKTGGARGHDAVEAYHDRIREFVLSGLTPGSRRSLHRALAEAFEGRPATEPDLLSLHWRGAGEISRARSWAIRAGERAFAALAFDRAASQYRVAIECDPAAADRAELDERLAISLFNAGRASEAAPVFASAAGRASGLKGRDLRRRAADAWLHGGHIEPGLEALRPLLAEAGLRYPSPAGAMLSIGGEVLRHLFSRPDRWKVRQVPTDEDIHVLDLGWGAGKVLTNIFPMVGLHLHLSTLRRALQLEDPRRQGRSLLLVGTLFLSLGGPLARSGKRMFALAEKLAAETNDPYLRGLVLVFQGVNEFSSAGRWSLAGRWSEEGMRLLRDHCVGIEWEYEMGLATSLKAAEFEMDPARCGERATVWLREAAERDDLYAQAVAGYWACLHRLAAGDEDGARGLMRRLIARWPQTGYSVQHFHALRIEVFCDLYRGNPGEALRRFEADLPNMRRTGLHRLVLTRLEMNALEGLFRLGLAARGIDVSTHLARVKAIAASLGKEARSDGPPLGRFFRASVAALTGRSEEALALLRACEAAARDAGMLLMAAGARWRIAELSDDAASKAEVGEWFRQRGVAELEPWLAVNAPPVRAVA